MLPRQSLPIVHSQNAPQTLATWHNTLKNLTRSASPPPTPLNFTATNSQGGIQLTWAPVQNPVIKNQLGTSTVGPDGYVLWRSPSGTFTTDLTVIKLPNAGQTSYFDSIGSTPTKVSYRLVPTAGSPSRAQSILGAPSGTVTHTSIAPTDTTTVPSNVVDAYTNDSVRATSSRGHYGIAQYAFYRGVQN